MTGKPEVLPYSYSPPTGIHAANCATCQRSAANQADRWFQAVPCVGMSVGPQSPRRTSGFGGYLAFHGNCFLHNEQSKGIGGPRAMPVVVPASELSSATVDFLRTMKEECRVDTCPQNPSRRELPSMRPELMRMWLQGLGSVVSYVDS